MCLSLSSYLLLYDLLLRKKEIKNRKFVCEEKRGEKMMLKKGARVMVSV